MPDQKQQVICNTTPLIALSIIDQLALLEQLYGSVLIPTAVEDEIEAGKQGKAGFHAIQAAAWITTVPLEDPIRAALLSDLDRGEAEVIALALETGADLIILDERLARQHAARLGLTMTGTLGILVRAKQKGLIDLVRPYIELLLAGGIYLSDALIDHALALAGESR
jgi:predicted nucleic acid-binding protein